MTSMCNRFFATLLACLVLAWPVAAQETTGGIAGVVRDSAAAVLPGATVNLTGPAGTLSAVTDERGEYRFPRLPPGHYTVKAELQSFAAGTSAADVTVGNVSRVEFTLGLASLSETVQVTATSSVVDVNSSATATTISKERIDFIPRGRDFTDVVSQAAGATNESQAGGISIDGSSGSENKFIIDGVDTTNPQVGTSAIPMRAEFMEQVQVKSAGYAAEFGGSTGGVINAITRSGTNAFHGYVLSDFQQRSWGGAQRPILADSLTSDTEFVYIHPPKDDETRVDPGVSLGGPIFRNRLWFFGQYQPGIRNTSRTVTFTDGTTNTFDQDFTVHYGALNVSGNAASKLLFKGGFNVSPYETKGDLPVQTGRTSLTSPDNYLRGTKGSRQTYSGSVDYIPSPHLTISARVGRFLTDSKSTGVEFPGLIHNFSTASTPAGIAAIPEPYRRVAGYSSDVLITDATAKDEYTRDAIGADATYYVSAGGEHQIKAGVQSEKIGNDVQSGYNADRIIYYAGRTYTAVAGPRTGTYGYFRLLNISTLGAVSSRNTALFVQDQWRVNQRLTLNVGLRTEHEAVPNFGEGQATAIDFGFGQKLAPRIGVTYDPFADGLTKIYGSFGKYFDVMKYELPRGSFGGDKWVDYYYTWDNPNFEVNTAANCATKTNTLSERPACAAGTFIEALDRRHNSAANGGEGIDPNLKPMEENEYQLGVTRELGNRFRNVVVGARYIRKNLVRTIEDVGVLECDATASCGEVFYIANPGEGITLSLANAPGVPAFPKAKRQYDGVEFTMERRFASNWGVSGSYTYSRLYGNYSGLASSDENGRTSPNVNRFFDAIQNSYDLNGRAVFGRLGTDRPHQFKGQFLYRFPWNTTLGLNERIASGIPVSEEASVGADVPFFPFGRGNLGRTPAFNQTDLSLWQDVQMGRTGFQVGVTILNLFDQDIVTRRYTTRTVGAFDLSNEEFFAGGLNYDALLKTVDPDVKFNQANQWQAPREVRLTLKFQF
jgi:outer membrane receptor protein involved in Fe transport